MYSLVPVNLGMKQRFKLRRLLVVLILLHQPLILSRHVLVLQICEKQLLELVISDDRIKVRHVRLLKHFENLLARRYLCPHDLPQGQLVEFLGCIQKIVNLPQLKIVRLEL